MRYQHQVGNRQNSGIFKSKLFIIKSLFIINLNEIIELTMTDLVLHAVLYDKKNYHLFRFKFLIKA